MGGIVLNQYVALLIMSVYREENVLVSSFDRDNKRASLSISTKVRFVLGSTLLPVVFAPKRNDDEN